MKLSSDRCRVDLMREQDRRTLWVFLGLLAVSLVATVLVATLTEYTTYQALPLISLPLLVLGVVNYFIRRRFIAAIVIAAATVVAYLIAPAWALVILFLLVCAEGVAVMIEVIQRLTFYRIMSTVEYVNLRKELSIGDHLALFFFNIPCDIDTRGLTMDDAVRRTNIPWSDMLESMLLALVLCMFLWIYMFLNPSFSVATSGVPTYTFTIMLYVALLVMPWTIFKSLNVRIDTDYRSFSLYRGMLETIKRMFLPALAAVVILALALFSGAYTVYYLAMSVVMIAATIVFSSTMYYTSNEPAVVADITEKWTEFRPSPIYAPLREKAPHRLDDGVPGTPKRSRESCFVRYNGR